MKINSMRKLVELIKERPHLFFETKNDSIYLYINYFNGFFLALQLSKQQDLERQISKWYQERVVFKAPNMNWTSQFLLINKHKTDKEQIGLFLGTLIEYFEDNPVTGLNFE